MKIIDAHFHINFCGFDLEKTIRYMDQNKIDLCWLMSWEELCPGKWPYEFLSVEDIYEAYAKKKDRFVPMYAPDPTRQDAVEKLRYWVSKGIKGCAEMKFTLKWNDVNIIKLLNAVRKLKLPVVFHMEEAEFRYIDYKSADCIEKILLRLFGSSKIFGFPKVFMEFLSNLMPFLKYKAGYDFPGYMLEFNELEKILKRFSDITFIGHGPLFWKHISADALLTKEKYTNYKINKEGIVSNLLREYKNLYADISGYSGFNAITRDKDFIKIFLSEFSDKILYGTDNLMVNQREILDSLKLSTQTYKKIYSDNALQIINL